ncbi:MAG TPA: IMP dehydrogenase [Nitrospira sp.]|jgi:IMP dehydrogenase|nr:guaB [Nitrospira sp.]HET6679498.1 IMP dehydrogenase [Nitrospira sp.]
MLEKEPRLGLTYDDVVLVPSKSAVLPSEVDVRTQLTRNIQINIPIISSAMDTVTESRLAIAMAREGGVGIIHRVLTPADQAAEVDRVKKSESGMILDPVTISPDQTIRDAHELMARYRISGIPVTKSKKLVGILTNRDLRFETRLDLKVSQVMKRDKLVTAPEGTSLEKAREILHEHRIEKLPVVNKHGDLKGLITIKDIEKRIKYPNACKDAHGRLRVGAAVGVGPDIEDRVTQLKKAGVDLLVVDTAHGHAQAVLETVRMIKKQHPSLELIAGNIATAEAAKDLLRAGVDAVKVGVGPGSICTTRIVSGSGMPQLTAIADCAKVLEGSGVPIVADGGIKFSGDISKALAAGASVVMLGGLLAGTEESPGETVLYQARTYKVYRGMGSIGAMERGGGDRYGQSGRPAQKLVPEGIEGRVPYKGPLSAVIYQLVGGVKSGMGYCGCKTIPELQKNASFIRQTVAGLRESHVHDVIITKEAPNYRMDWE